MSLPGWESNPNIVPPCKTDRESWQCPNMKGVEGDTDMSGEHYECKVCGRTEFLDYDEMR
jgi:hypothetical protein